MAQELISLDTRRRPRLCLAASMDGPDHHVILESVRPVVKGFCTTCFEEWQGSRAEMRKARSCSVMVAYLGEVNRNRPLADEIRLQVDTLRGRQTRLS